jgi:hypothetical protein
MKPIAQIARKFHWLAIAKNFDGHFGLIHDQFAFVALYEVALNFVLRRGIEFAIDEVREFADDFVAVQFAPPCLK